MLRKVVSFTGGAGSGPLSASGTRAGDAILFVATALGEDHTTQFVKFVLADGEVLQLVSGLDGVALVAIIERHVTS